MPPPIPVTPERNPSAAPPPMATGAATGFLAVSSLVRHSRAGAAATSARWRELVTLPERWSAPKFPLKAADFVARGVPEGPALGQALGLAEDAWLAQGFPLDAAALDAIAAPIVVRLKAG